MTNTVSRKLIEIELVSKVQGLNPIRSTSFVILQIMVVKYLVSEDDQFEARLRFLLVFVYSCSSTVSLFLCFYVQYRFYFVYLTSCSRPVLKMTQAGSSHYERIVVTLRR